MTYEQLVMRLRQRYGPESKAETALAHLYYRRKRADEGMRDLLHEIRRLVVLVYPIQSNGTTKLFL